MLSIPARVDRLIYSVRVTEAIHTKRANWSKMPLTNRGKVSRSSCRCIDLARMLIKDEGGGAAFVTGRAHYRPRRLIHGFSM